MSKLHRKVESSLNISIICRQHLQCTCPRVSHVRIVIRLHKISVREVGIIYNYVYLLAISYTPRSLYFNLETCSYASRWTYLYF